MLRSFCCRIAVLGALPALVVAVDDAHYQVHIDAALARLSVTACTGARVLRARNPHAGAFLLETTAHADGARDTLEVPAGQRCVNYAVDARAAAATDPRYAGTAAGTVAVSPALWLWLPPAADGLRIDVELPAGVLLSAPWPTLPARAPRRRSFRLPPSPRSDDAVTVFGRFDACRIAAGATRFDIAVLPGRQRGSNADLLAWLAAGSGNVLRAYGRFPGSRVQVVVVPVARSDDDDSEPVPFGHVIRDGGDAVQFFVNQRRALADFRADWTATHEFSHLLLPHVGGEKWIAEGLASYYQNVLMARGGAYRARAAWRRLLEGFDRGRRSVPDLSLEDAMPVGRWNGIMKTYWGGAAVFLMLDVELRARGGPGASLDQVLRRLADCCLPSPRRWQGRELFAELDRLAPIEVFRDSYDRHHAARAFPHVGATLARLGVDWHDGQPVFVDDAELAAVRRAIMARSPLPVVQSSSCAH